MMLMFWFGATCGATFGALAVGLMLTNREPV